MVKSSDRPVHPIYAAGNILSTHLFFQIQGIVVYMRGRGVFFHDKMPGCCLPSLTAATALHFTAGHLKFSRQQEPTPSVAFLGGNSPLLLRSCGAIIFS
jgi:hypothetical protein